MTNIISLRISTVSLVVVLHSTCILLMYMQKYMYVLILHIISLNHSTWSGVQHRGHP